MEAMEESASGCRRPQGEVPLRWAAVASSHTRARASGRRATVKAAGTLARSSPALSSSCGGGQGGYTQAAGQCMWTKTNPGQQGCATASSLLPLFAAR